MCKLIIVSYCSILRLSTDFQFSSTFSLKSHKISTYTPFQILKFFNIKRSWTNIPAPHPIFITSLKMTFFLNHFSKNTVFSWFRGFFRFFSLFSFYDILTE